MRQAQQEAVAFMERQDKTDSPEEEAEDQRLLRAVQQSIADFWDAFNAAAAEDIASRHKPPTQI
ncbi:MAG: hypothetical protein HY648_04045 [Acidobacteria bacterium]|nr:hypothetical protein [Acidobacteriota bacterium]